MSKVQLQPPTNPNNSGTSSENSDPQSVEDHQPVLPTSNRSAALSRAKSSWKRMKELAAEKEKENEAKRPPWRAVSVSTLPKPDKNALLRAKLLDASRRLRAGKTNVAIQTDFVPTKLMKDAGIGSQKDLILQKDVAILTDGQYSIKKDAYNQYILTYSVSQMTDIIDTSNISTQTLLPKAYDKVIANQFFIDLEEESDESCAEGNEMKTKRTHGMKLNPTLESWRFDDDSLKMDDKQHFIPYTIQANKPWRSFIPLPFQLRGSHLIGSQTIDWPALLQSIDDLVRESNNLVDRLEGIIQDKQTHRKNVLKTLDDIKSFEPSTLKFPSEQWLPLIEKQEMELKAILESN